MDTSNLSAKDVLEESGLEEYEAGMKFFHSELVELNVIVYLAEKIIDFPFELFADPDETIFFGMVMRSFYNSAILIVTRLATDQKGDLYTLSRFKNRVLELANPQFKDALRTRLRKAHFNQGVANLLEKAQELRSNRIAHTTRDLIFDKIQVSRPTLSEIIELRDALNLLLDTLSFNVSYMMLPIPYAPNVSHPSLVNHKTDIEELLESIARNSKLLNMPESSPETWTRMRANLGEEKIDKINLYRHKLGLPEA